MKTGQISPKDNTSDVGQDEDQDQDQYDFEETDETLSFVSFVTKSAASQTITSSASGRHRPSPPVLSRGRQAPMQSASSTFSYHNLNKEEASPTTVFNVGGRDDLTYTDYSRVTVRLDPVASILSSCSASSPAVTSSSPNSFPTTAFAAGATSTKDPTFPVKLHQMLSCGKFDDAITWLPHGRAFRILKQKLFEERVIPLFFRHGRFASFARQVNGWGFRRVCNGADYGAYYHELFLRGKSELCERMRRPPPGGIRKNKKGHTAEPAPDFYAISQAFPLPRGPESSDGSSNSIVKLNKEGSHGDNTLLKSIHGTLAKGTSSPAPATAASIGADAFNDGHTSLSWDPMVRAMQIAALDKNLLQHQKMRENSTQISSNQQYLPHVPFNFEIPGDTSSSTGPAGAGESSRSVQQQTFTPGHTLSALGNGLNHPNLHLPLHFYNNNNDNGNGAHSATTQQQQQQPLLGFKTENGFLSKSSSSSSSSSAPLVQQQQSLHNEISSLYALLAQQKPIQQQMLQQLASSSTNNGMILMGGQPQQQQNKQQQRSIPNTNFKEQNSTISLTSSADEGSSSSATRPIASGATVLPFPPLAFMAGGLPLQQQHLQQQQQQQQQWDMPFPETVYSNLSMIGTTTQQQQQQQLPQLPQYQQPMSLMGMNMLGDNVTSSSSTTTPTSAQLQSLLLSTFGIQLGKQGELLEQNGGGAGQETMSSFNEL